MRIMIRSLKCSIELFETQKCCIYIYPLRRNRNSAVFTMKRTGLTDNTLERVFAFSIASYAVISCCTLILLEQQKMVKKQNISLKKIGQVRKMRRWGTKRSRGWQRASVPGARKLLLLFGCVCSFSMEG